MKTALFIALAAIIEALVNGALTGPVKVTGGQIAGVPASDLAVVAFKGIPFAAPPVGNLRWRDPQPVKAWQGVRKADQFGNSVGGRGFLHAGRLAKMPDKVPRNHG
jgi:para-nitrobenzyl esterase